MFLIAEAGINHNGDIDLALQMVRVAKWAGCDAVKFQIFDGDKVPDTNPDAAYSYEDAFGKTVHASRRAMLKSAELSHDHWRALAECCDSAGIEFMATPQNHEDLEFYLSLNPKRIKVGSDDFTNLPLLKHYASFGLPMILSCGMSDADDILRACETVGDQLEALLICTSEYPCPENHANVSRVRQYLDSFALSKAGFSDHTSGTAAACAACAQGAEYFETHFTLSRFLAGPDHAWSNEPDALKEWCDALKRTVNVLGTGLFHPTPDEKKLRERFQRRVAL
jgi:sialic acid synthase SpsE